MLAANAASGTNLGTPHLGTHGSNYHYCDVNSNPALGLPRLIKEGDILRLGSNVINLANRLVRPRFHNQTSHQKRRFILAPATVLELDEVVEMRNSLEQKFNAGELSLEEVAAEDDRLVFQIIKLVTYEGAEQRQRSGRNQADHPCTTLAGAQAALRESFDHHIRPVFTLGIIESIAKEFLPDGCKLHGRGAMTSIEATLLLLMRLGRADTTFDSLSACFKRPASHLSDFFNDVINKIDDKFGSLLDLEEMTPVFSLRMSAHYKSAIDKILAEKHPDTPDVELIDAFSFIVDGIRLNIARSIDADQQRADYSAYTCLHNILCGIVVGPCGMVVGVSHRCFGCNNDLAFQDEVIGAMARAHDAALGDGIFNRIEGALYPIPNAKARKDYGITDEACAKYSSVRIIVEWIIGYLKKWFPYGFDGCKMSSGVNRMGIFRVLVLIYNALVCLRGSQAGLYFKLRPFNLQHGEEMLRYYLSLR